MKALVYKGPGVIELKEVKRPEPSAGELLIKIKAVGICGSDFEGYLGKTGRRTPPMIMGHEMSGVVEKSITGGRFKSGDKVVIQPKLYCGTCDYCQQGLTHMCPEAEFLGVLSKDGGMTEFIIIPEEYVYPVKEGVSFTEASMVEPLAVAYRAVNKISNKALKQAESVMIIGGGTIGLLILQLLKLNGADNIIVSDMFDSRLKKARLLGADYTVNPGEQDILAEIHKITDNKMVDICFEAVGLSASASQSLQVLKKTGTAVWVGNAQKMIEVNMQRIVTSEIKIQGTYIYTDPDFLASLKLIEAGKINFNPIISKETKLENGVDAFKQLQENKDGELIKIILKN